MTFSGLVLFDVDGTLVDSNYLHTLAWSRALAAAGEWAPMNAIHRLIGMESMDRGDGDAQTTFVVGDSTWDVEAATAARLPCIAVESGGFSDAELRRAGAIEVYRDVSALRTNIRTSPLAALLS